jgi:signal transduction histidine kinase
VATLGAMLVTILAIAARIQGGDTTLSPAVPILTGAAGVCAALLLRRPAPSLAWLALIVGSLIAASLPFGRSRAANPYVGIDAWLDLAVAAAGAALITMAIAVGYALRPSRRPGRWSATLALAAWVWLAIAFSTTIGLMATGLARPDPAFTWLDVAALPLEYFLHFVLAVTAIGVVADVRSGMQRAMDQEPAAVGAAARTPERIRSVAVATFRELVPGGSAVTEARLAAERSSLAGDLHAVVLPGLRRAIAEAESGGDPDALARHLRTIDLELERLMADRWPVVLEAFGLVAALEDLAERIEADSRLAVQIDVGRTGARPPATIERAAWRVAQIAIDNAARHAMAGLVSIAVSVDPDRLSLVVTDDGTGFDPATTGRIGARGLADATRRAAAIGATVRVDSRPAGGTSVAFDWAARRT